MKLAREAIDAMLAKADAEAIVTVTQGPAWLSDPVQGDQSGGPSFSQLPAVSGYPHLTVPMGLMSGLPVGLSFVGTAWRDGRLLELGAAYEGAAKARVKPGYRPSVDAGTGVEGSR
jgi:amidase